MKFSSLTILTLAIFITACASITSIPAKITRINYPIALDENTVRIGASMIKKSKTYSYSALTLDDELIVGGGLLTKIKFPPQTLKATLETKDKTIYIANEAFQIGISKTAYLVVAGICIDKNKNKWKVFTDGTCVDFLSVDPIPAHSFGTTYTARRPSLTRELVYNGRLQNNIKVIYRELSNNVMRPAFQQELQYDLSETSEIAFKEVIIDIIKADNREITYMIKHHFDDIE